LLFVALAAWAMSYLNTEGEFFTPSLAPAFFNVFSIAMPLALFAYYTHRGGDPIFGAAIGVTVGGLMQFAVQGPSLLKKGFKYRPYLNFGKGRQGAPSCSNDTGCIRSRFPSGCRAPSCNYRGKQQNVSGVIL